MKIQNNIFRNQGKGIFLKQDTKSANYDINLTIFAH